MERETKTIITPISKQEIVILSYITGREQREINGALYKNTNVEMVDGQPVFNKIDTKEMINAVQDATIEALIVSIGGNKKNKLEIVLNMIAEDYDFVMNELNEIRNGKKKE